MEQRTVRDFVKDLAMRGRDNRSIFAVAKCTRWSNQIESVVEWSERRGEKWRVKGRRLRRLARHQAEKPQKIEEKPAKRIKIRIKLKKS